MPPSLVIEVIGDASSFEKELRKTRDTASRFSKDMERGGRGAQRATVGVVGLGRAAGAAGAAFFGAQGLTAAIGTSIEAASSLEEQTSKSRAVFRENSRELERWATTTADSFGIARDEALVATGTFGNLFRTVNLGTDEAAAMSRRLTELAADLASFNDASPEEALDALRSGLIGEAEPLRRFGVLLSEARVQQEAMRATGKRTAKELTNQEKALARYSIILKDTVPAQGDFAKTQGSFANQSRRLRAQLRNSAAALATELLPALNATVTALIAATKAANAFGTAIGDAFEQGGADIGAWPRRLGEEIHKLGEAFGLSEKPADAYAAALKRVKDQADATAESLRIFNTLSEGAQNAPDNRQRFRPPPEPPPTLRAGATAEQRNQWFDAMIGRRVDRVQDIRTLQGQIDALKQIAQLIRERIAITKDITRRLTLEDELLDVQRQEQSVRDQMRANALAQRQAELDRERARIEKQREAAERARAAAAERRRKLLEKIQQTQFRALGLDPLTGGERIPGTRELRRQLGGLTEAVRGTFLDTNKTRSLMGQIRKVLSGGLGAVGREVRQKVKEMLDEIDNQLKERQGGTKFRAVDTSKVLAGLGLSPDEIRELRGRISQIGRDRKVPTRGGGAFGVGIPLSAFGTAPVVVQSTINMDGQKVATNTTRHQQRRARGTAAQRGGRNGGQAVGLA